MLLYIRKETDEAYDGLLLKEPTLNGLKEAVSSVYYKSYLSFDASLLFSYCGKITI